jgi:hypothetical protein
MQDIPSYKYPLAIECLFEFLWGAAFVLTEDLVEVGNVVKSASVGDLRYRLGGVYQHSGNMSQAYLRELFGEGETRMLFYEAAKGGFGHMGQPGDLAEGDGLAEFLVYIIEYLLEAAAVIIDRLFAKCDVGQQGGVPGGGQVV